MHEQIHRTSSTWAHHDPLFRHCFQLQQLRLVKGNICNEPPAPFPNTHQSKTTINAAASAAAAAHTPYTIHHRRIRMPKRKEHTGSKEQANCVTHAHKAHAHAHTHTLCTCIWCGSLSQITLTCRRACIPTLQLLQLPLHPPASSCKAHPTTPNQARSHVQPGFLAPLALASASVAFVHLHWMVVGKGKGKRKGQEKEVRQPRLLLLLLPPITGQHSLSAHCQRSLSFRCCCCRSSRRSSRLLCALRLPCCVSGCYT